MVFQDFRLHGSVPPCKIVREGNVRRFFTDQHNPNINITQPPQNPTLEGVSFSISEQNPHTSAHQNDTFLCSERVICMSDLPDDPREVITVWSSLPEAIKAGIVAMVKVTRQSTLYSRSCFLCCFAVSPRHFQGWLNKHYLRHSIFSSISSLSTPRPSIPFILPFLMP